ncbi:MAG: hypothetical protein EBY01_03690 [Actinobacteria bacterium]|nr:hypothetical protein [Actinomycetota bacterium]
MGKSPNHARISVALFAPENSRYLEAIQGLDLIGTTIDKSHSDLFGEVDLAIFLIEADRGLANEEIETFHQIRQLQLPTLILVSSLVPTSNSLDQWDFDDVVMLVNRVLEPSITPFLVLHGDDGTPSGLFDLAQNKVIDYSSTQRTERAPDSDLIHLTEEFRSEYQESGYREGDFTSGLTVVTLPFIPERGIGLIETEGLLTRLQQAQI